jgi:methionine-rich copper-binding protein CopC
MNDKVSSNGSVSRLTIVDKGSKENNADEWRGVDPLRSLTSQFSNQQETFNDHTFNDHFIGSIIDGFNPVLGISSVNQQRGIVFKDENSGIQDAAARITVDTTAPKVSSFRPADGGSNIHVSTNITITFNEDIKAGSGSIQIRAGSSTGTVVESFDVASSSNLTFSGSTLTIDPYDDFALGTRYYVTFAKGTVTDLAGNSYAGSSSYDFITILPDTTAPKVVTFSPSDASRNVALDSNITVTFSEAIRAGSGAVEIHNGSATGVLIESFDVTSSDRLTFSGNTLTIDPTADLLNNRHYYVTFAKGTVADLAGNGYAGSSSYDFYTIVGDITAPTVTGFTPSDASRNVALDTNITVNFSEAIKAGSGSIQIHSGSATGTIVESFDVASSSHLTFSGSTLTIDPTADLLNNRHYYVTFAKGTVTDLAGNGYAGSSSYDFYTIIGDIIAPTVINFNPGDGRSNVALDTNITVTFSEAIRAGSGAVEIHICSATGTLVESFDVSSSDRLAFSGNMLTIDPTDDLLQGTHYYVTFAKGTVTDLASNSYAGTSVYDFGTLIMDRIGDIISWSTISGFGLLNVEKMLERATGNEINDAPLYGDGYGSKDWGLNDIQAPDAWQAGYTGDGIIVAVVDTGVNYTHSDLAGNIWVNTSEVVGNGIDDDGNGYVDDIYGYDFVNRDGYALDDKGHGTHVAGIIAGLRNGTGVTGVAYDATIMPVKVLDATGNGSFSNVAAGIIYAVDNGADVINLSVGAYGSSSSSVTSAITYALNHGVLVCMAAGNDSQSAPTYPAILSETTGGIAVGAVNSSDTVASFSNDAGSMTPYDYVVAPGVSIYSTYTGTGYAIMSGTSMATPYVAGAAALLLSAEPDFSSAWTLGQLENILSMSAQSLETSSLAGTTGTTSSLTAASVSDTDIENDTFLLGIFDSVVDSYAEPVELTGVITGVESGYEVHIV